MGFPLNSLGLFPRPGQFAISFIIADLIFIARDAIREVSISRARARVRAETARNNEG